MLSGEHEEEGDRSRLPKPPPITAQGAINPTLHILLSFPAPQLAAPTPLVTAALTPTTASRENSSLEDGEGAALDCLAEEQKQLQWDPEELKALSRHVQESAAVLVQTGKFTRFLQEELHRETFPMAQRHSATCDRGAPAARFPPDAGAGGLSTAAAADQLHNDVKGTVTRLLTTTAHRTSIDHPTTLDKAKSGSWVPASSSSGMLLRSRVSQPINAPRSTSESRAAAQSSVETGGKRADSAEAKQEPEHRATPLLPPHPLGVAAVSPKPTDCIDASFRGVAKEAFEHSEAVFHDLGALHQFNSLLPLCTDPFKDTPTEKIMNFLSLMSSSASMETEAAAAATQVAPEDAKAVRRRERAEWKAGVRGLSCLIVITHGTFSPDAVPDQLVDRLVSVFGSVVRCVGQALSRPAAELVDASGGETAKAAAHSRAGRYRHHVGGGGGMPSAAAAAAGSADAPTALMWVELLRLYVKRFGLVVCGRGLSLVSDSELERLEDDLFQCLFLVPHRSTSRDVFLTYSSYVMDAAVHTYHCLWNHMEVQSQRRLCADHFFPRLLLSEYLTLRTYNTADGRQLMPLTVAMLAAAQSTPIGAGAIGDNSAERLLQQCDGWARALVEVFLLGHLRKDSEKATQDTAWLVVTQLLEDLTDLLGAPEWPAADVLLRLCVVKLAHMGIGGAGSSNTSVKPADGKVSTTAPPPQSDLAGVDLPPLAAHVVDVIAHVAARLFDPAVMALTGAEARSRFVSEVNLESAIGQDWQNAMALQPSAKTEGAGDGTASAAEKRSEQSAQGVGAQGGAEGPADNGEEETGSTPHHKMECLVYYALSRNVEVHSAPDVASLWFHARAAHLLLWRRQFRHAPIPEAALEKLVRAAAVPCGGLEVGWDRLRCWCKALASAEDDSMLSPTMRSTLISLLLSVFGDKDGHGAEAAASDVVVRKALSHLTKLCDLYPPLLRQVWPIVQRCVHDDSARVRESSVPLLLTLLSGVVGSGHGGSGRRGGPGNGDGGAAAAAAAALSASASVVAAPTPEEERRAEGIVSKLVHLLHDKSMAVVTRAIAALDSLLVDKQYSWLLGGGAGGAVLSVVQSNLLSLADYSAERKHRVDVTRHFLRRWAVTLMEEEEVGSYRQLARELATLTMLSAKEFPHDVTPEHPLVVLLRNMHHSVSGGGGGHAATSAVGLTGAVGKRRSKNTVEGQQLNHAMCSAARALWAQYLCPSPTCAEAIRSLATLHVLALVSREWVEALLEPLGHCLTWAHPTPSQEPRFSDAGEQSDFVAGTLLQTCHIMRAVLASPKVPTVSLNYLSQQLNRVLSRYVGKLQSRVIVACIGALTAMINCGARHRLSTTEVNQTYLQHCYAMMNSYYASTSALLDGLESKPQSLPYVQRFLFLLSEFLRQYPGWGNPALKASLAQTPVGGVGAAQQNVLAKGVGICGNVYSLVERVLVQCQRGESRQRVFAICLRVLSSLCMMEPTTYLYRSEPFLREALVSPDYATRVQGVTLIRDFLVDEDSRVDLAARLTDRLMMRRGDASLASSSSSSSSSSMLLLRSKGRGGSSAVTMPRRMGKRRGKGTKRQKRASNASEETEEEGENDEEDEDGRHSAALTELQDQNSGMSTWLVQSFHASITELSLSGDTQVRSICLEILLAVAQGGLMPPVKYLDVAAALATDADPVILRKATQLLSAHAERYESVLSAQVNRTVQLIYQLHNACGADLVDSALTKPRSGFSKGESSVYAPVFALLHKRNRVNFIVTLTRFFHQDAKAVSWCRKYFPAELQETCEVPLSSREGMFRSGNPVTFLSHLAVATGLCPFTVESDVVVLLQHCRAGIDLNGQSSLDWVTALQRGSGARGKTGDEEEGATVDREQPDLLLPLWKSLGVVLLSYVRRAVRLEYHMTASKLHRYATSASSSPSGFAGHSAPLHARQPHSGATVALLSCVHTLVEHASPLLLLLHRDRSALKHEDANDNTKIAVETGLSFLRAELEAALMDDGGHELLHTTSGDSKAGHPLAGPASTLRARRELQSRKSNARKRGRAETGTGKGSGRSRGGRGAARRRRKDPSSSSSSSNDEEDSRDDDSGGESEAKSMGSAESEGSAEDTTDSSESDGTADDDSSEL